MVADTELSAHSDDGVLSVIAATEKALSWLQAVQLRALPSSTSAGKPTSSLARKSPRY
jgi:hypothetical protein